EDLSEQFWTIITHQSQLEQLKQDDLYRQYKKDVSERLWIGQLNELQFLHFLERFQIFLTVEQLRDIIKRCLLPLPAFEKVEQWAKTVPIHIMSNHVTNWLMPALAPLKPYITDYYIS